MYTAANYDISIHAPRVGSDQTTLNSPRCLWISIHAPRVGSDGKIPGHYHHQTISIHAPRVGSDSHPSTSNSYSVYFNPRSPCGERPWSYQKAGGRMNFNPRSPCGERLCPARIVPTFCNFNPRSPCGERRYPRTTWKGQKSISIHAPRVGSDCTFPRPPNPGTGFQSTLPVWGATPSHLLGHST